MKDVILHSKTGEGLGSEFGPAATLFILAKVGTDEKADIFIDEITEDEDVSSMICTPGKPLDEIMKNFVIAPGKSGYTEFVSYPYYFLFPGHLAV